MEVSMSQILKRPYLKIKQHGINTSFWVEEAAKILPLRSELHFKSSFSGDVGRFKKRFSQDLHKRSKREVWFFLLDRYDCFQQLRAEIWSNSAFWWLGEAFLGCVLNFHAHIPWVKRCAWTSGFLVPGWGFFSWSASVEFHDAFTVKLSLYPQYCVLQCSHCSSTVIWPKIPCSLMSDDRVRIYRAA